MGKGNRNRQNAARGVLAGAGAKTAGKNTKNYKTWVGTLIVTLVLLALIAVVLFSALHANGTFDRRRVMVSSENYDITVAEMAYLVNVQYQNFVDMYQSSGYMPYIRGTGGSGLSTSTPLRQQNYSVKTDEVTGETEVVTWFDYFASSALASAKELLSLCEGARHFGITLSEEDEANIQQTLDTIKRYGELTGYGTNGYLRNVYGKGVRLSDVRDMMRMSALAAKYLEIGRNQADGSVTEDMINLHFDSNREEYENRIDYIGAAFDTEFIVAPPESDDMQAENEANAVAYETEQNKLQARVDALAACTDAESFRALLKSYFKEDILAEGETDEEAAEAEAEDRVSECVFKDVTDEDSSDPEMATWLFNGEPHSQNETQTFVNAQPAFDESAGEYKNNESTYKVLIVTTPRHTDTAVVRSVGHILFKTDTYQGVTNPETFTGKIRELAERVTGKGLEISAATMSHELLNLLFEEGKITEQEGRYVIDEAVFEEYGKIYNEDSNIFYDDVKVGDMVAEFNDWMFDAARVEGDITYPDAVSTQYGYHIMYYRGNEQPAWRANVLKTLSDDAYDAWKEAAEIAYKTTVSEKIDSLWSKVGA